MKNTKIIKGFAGIIALTALSFNMTSCSDDYLDLAPITDISSSTVTSTLTGAEAAFVGLCNGMYRGCDDYLGFNGTNGEPWILGFYAEGMGNSNIKGIWNYSASFVNNYSNWTYMNTPSSGVTVYMWRYCYNLIDDANNLIQMVDEMEAAEDEKDELEYIKASALTIRSHAYIHLLQTYAPRWADSNNGNTYCVILRTEPSSTENADKDFSTMGEVLDQIYSDLNQAISLFNGSSYNRGSNVWMPNIDVARGLYARAALLKNDYSTALSMANAALQNYSLMTASEYRSGFIYANSEYIWASDLEAQDLGWNTFGSWTGFNGYYTWAFGILDSMDYTLYKNLSMSDCRKLLYFTPELMELAPNLADAYGLTSEDFFYSSSNKTNPGIIVPYNYKTQANGANAAYYFLDSYGWGEYMAQGYEAALVNYDSNLSEWNGYVIPTFGGSFKFWGEGEYAYSQFPFMRASEMGYIVAEAQYMLGNTSDAQSMMVYLNKNVRDPEYTCELTGEALLKHIKAYREIELWGEGHNWFDLKRWGDPCIRNPWVEGNYNCGNWGSLCKSFEPGDMAGWRYSVPQSEFTYNKGADQNKVNY